MDTISISPAVRYLPSARWTWTDIFLIPWPCTLPPRFACLFASQFLRREYKNVDRCAILFRRSYHIASSIGVNFEMQSHTVSFSTIEDFLDIHVRLQPCPHNGNILLNATIVETIHGKHGLFTSERGIINIIPFSRNGR
jgi:hypothetical protein